MTEEQNILTRPVTLVMYGKTEELGEKSIQ
jgi:hypothetical protein